MAKSDNLDRLPLPKSWPRLAKRALVLVNSMLNVSFDIELGRRLDCASRHAREYAKHERLCLDNDSDREVLRLVRARFGRMDPKKRTHYTRSVRPGRPRCQPDRELHAPARAVADHVARASRDVYSIAHAA